MELSSEVRFRVKFRVRVRVRVTESLRFSDSVLPGRSQTEQFLIYPLRKVAINRVTEKGEDTGTGTERTGKM